MLSLSKGRRQDCPLREARPCSQRVEDGSNDRQSGGEDGLVQCYQEDGQEHLRVSASGGVLFEFLVSNSPPCTRCRAWLRSGAADSLPRAPPRPAHPFPISLQALSAYRQRGARALEPLHPPAGASRDPCREMARARRRPYGLRPMSLWASSGSSCDVSALGTRCLLVSRARSVTL